MREDRLNERKRGRVGTEKEGGGEGQRKEDGGGIGRRVERNVASNPTRLG